jgi:hypothetical protein
MNTIRRHRRRASLHRLRMHSANARHLITTRFSIGRVAVPDYVPAAWLGEPTMNYRQVSCAAVDPWSAFPMFAGWAVP